jgi:hypothetical protein
MNNPEQKITPLQNSEDHEKLVQDYEAKIEQEKADKEKWKNAYLKSEQNRLEIGKSQERTAEERDDWKRQAFANRKIELEKKQNKEQNDFKTEFIKLQEQKRGLTWDETKGWVNK